VELLGSKWLCKIAVGAAVEKALAILSHGVRGERDDRYVASGAGFRAANLSRRFQPVHVRHPDVAQHQVEGLGQGTLERPGAVALGRYLVAGVGEGRDDLDGALVANETAWILDVKVSNKGAGADLPNGPFPAQAFVPNSAEYEGEVIIWITGGHVSGLGYAWVSDNPPTRWPRADEMQIVLQTGS